jgi:hypothetical protein
MPGFPLARGSAWAGGRDHTLNRVSPRWGTTSCREAAPLTPHAQPGTPHQLSRGRSTHTTRPAEYPTPAVERPLHSHHTPSRVAQRWGATSCREAAPLTPHAQPNTPHQLSRGRSTHTTRPAGYPSGGVPPAVERQLHSHHTPSRVPPGVERPLHLVSQWHAGGRRGCRRWCPSRPSSRGTKPPPPGAARWRTPWRRTTRWCVSNSFKSIAELMYPLGLKCLISLCTIPVSILSVPIQTVR